LRSVTSLDWSAAAKYLAVVASTVAAHEALHLLAAKLAGLQAKLSLKPAGFAVELKGFESYRSIFEVGDKEKAKRYLAVALAPYVLLPAYVVALSLACDAAVKSALAASIAYHAANAPLEVYQPALPIKSSRLRSPSGGGASCSRTPCTCPRGSS